MSQPTDDRSQRPADAPDARWAPRSDWDRHPRLLRGVRIGVIVLAVLAMALGITALVWPGATLITIAALFGVYLVVSGVARVAFALRARVLGAPLRWFSGLLGAAIAVIGVALLGNPAASLLLVAILLGIGWILEGLISIVTGLVEIGFTPRWWAVVSGVIAVIAGITVLMLPSIALQAFVIVGGGLLIVIGLSILIIAVQRPVRLGA